MASITFWNRLQPRPRTDSIAESLAARVGDPLWMLTRQWQFGEFRGEDAGSPAFVEVAGRFSRLASWETDRLNEQPLPFAPLERTAEGEAWGTSLALRIELGQTFEVLLADAGVGDLAPVFRAAFPLVPSAESPRLDPADHEAAELLAVCARRAIDGIALLQDVPWPDVQIPPGADVPPSAAGAVRLALQQLFEWARVVYGAFGGADAPSWRAERLEYQFRVRGDLSDPVSLSVRPAKGGEIDWFSFDVQSTGAGQPASGSGASFRRSVLPTHVRFRGMPQSRFWDFESGETDFGDVRPDTRDVAKLLFVDFMLVQGNDWFVVPLEQPVGTVCRSEPLVVHDVFGKLTAIARADAMPRDTAAPPWTMFSSSVEGAAGSVARILVVPPTATPATLSGPGVEEVAFVRDDVSQVVWAIEHAVESATGKPLSGYERDAARNSDTAANAAPPSGSPKMLPYRIQSRVPVHWVPFLPVITDAASGAVALERSALLATSPGRMPTPIEPAGRILRPSALGIGRYQLNEEEIPRVGVRVRRVIHRARWIDGATHVWVARRKSYERPVRTNPLRFDEAVE
jgi:hypothetical protein